MPSQKNIYKLILCTIMMATSFVHAEEVQLQYKANVPIAYTMKGFEYNDGGKTEEGFRLEFSVKMLEDVNKENNRFQHFDVVFNNLTVKEDAEKTKNHTFKPSRIKVIYNLDDRTLDGKSKEMIVEKFAEFYGDQIAAIPPSKVFEMYFVALYALPEKDIHLGKFESQSNSQGTALSKQVAEKLRNKVIDFKNNQITNITKDKIDAEFQSFFCFNIDDEVIKFAENKYGLNRAPLRRITVSANRANGSWDRNNAMLFEYENSNIAEIINFDNDHITIPIEMKFIIQSQRE